MQSTFGGAGTFADVLTSSYGLNLPEYGEATADGAPNNAPSSAASEAAAEAALAAEAGHGGGSEGGGHLITQLSAAQVKKDGYTGLGLGCVNSRPGARGSQMGDSRNLGTTLLPSPVLWWEWDTVM